MCSNKARVFVVDDHAMIVETLILILKSDGFEAKGFTNPTELLHHSMERTPDIVLSDYDMPQMTGAELCELMSLRYPACQCVMFSGRATDSDVQAAVLLMEKPLPVLAKPIHPRELLDLLCGLTQSQAVLPV